MKVFLDTNIFLEYFERRQQYQAVESLLSAIEDGKLKGVISTGCVYTLAYLVRMGFKRQGIHRPEQTLRVRKTLTSVLTLATVANVSHKRIMDAIKDLSFDDVEDSFQYQCALQSKCDYLITINLHDYSNADTSQIRILSPEEFVERILPLTI